MKTYLKKIDYFDTVIAFDEVNLSAIDLFRSDSLEIRTFDNLQEFEEAVNYYLRKHYKLTTKKEFDKQYIEFTKKLNKIAKEL